MVQGDLRGAPRKNIAFRRTAYLSVRFYVSGSAPIGITITIVVTQQINGAFGVLGNLERLINGVEQIVSELRSKIDQLCGTPGETETGIHRLS